VDDPPGDFLAGPIVPYISIGSVLTVALLATILAAALAAARTALYFAGLAGDGDVMWSRADQRSRSRARRWLNDARLLTVTIQFHHTAARVVAIVSLVACGLLAGNDNVFFGVVIPGVTCLVLTEAFARLFARKYPVRALSHLNVLMAIVSKTLVAARMLDRVNQRWRKRFGTERSVEEALAQVIELAAASDRETEKEVVKGIVTFGVLRVRDVMKHREEMSCLDISSNFEQVMAFVNEHRFSRIPVFRNSINRIEGVLYTKDLLPFFEQGKEFPWVNIIRPGYFVFANKKIDALLKDFQEKRVHIAIARDDNGNTAGLITLEDLIEVVIREINEQPDLADGQAYSRIDGRTYVFNGKTSIHEVFRLLDVEHPLLREATEFESLEDFIVEINDELPEVGEELSYDQFTFVVEAVENKRIKRVRVNVHAQA
jgi:putative hemolysin